MHDNTQYIAACIYDECAGSTLSIGYTAKCVVASAYAARCLHQHYLPANPQVGTMDVWTLGPAFSNPYACSIYSDV